MIGVGMFSCTGVKRNTVSTREWTVKLKDSIAIVHINLPLKYDTMHTWLCQSDFAGGDEYYYRIQPSKFSMAEEGCFLRYMSDTFYAVTISHFRLFEGEDPKIFNPHLSLANIVRGETRKENDLHIGQNFDTACLKIDDQEYSYIYRLEDYRADNVTNSITVTTRYNHRRITLTFESSLSKTKDSAFIIESLEALKTVRFEKAK